MYACRSFLACGPPLLRTSFRNIAMNALPCCLWSSLESFIGPKRLMSAPPAFLLAGALAGACASGMTTPFDVLKTRVSTPEDAQTSKEHCSFLCCTGHRGAADNVGELGGGDCFQDKQGGHQGGHFRGVNGPANAVRRACRLGSRMGKLQQAGIHMRVRFTSNICTG